MILIDFTVKFIGCVTKYLTIVLLSIPQCTTKIHAFSEDMGFTMDTAFGLHYNKYHAV